MTLPSLLLANLFYGNTSQVLMHGIFAPASALALEQAKLRNLLEPAMSEETLIPLVTLLSIAFTAYQVASTYSEVARTLGISVFTVKKKLV
jgi:hypothetical protein